MIIFSSPFSGRGGALGMRTVLRVQDPPVQGHSQPAGKVEPLLLFSAKHDMSKLLLPVLMFQSD